MPIFEYTCLDCGSEFEHLLRKPDDPVACPDCGHDRLERLISLSSVSSDASRAANLAAGHRKAAAKRFDKGHAEHAASHDHFGDTAHK